ncbi:uncharacterized protein PO2_contig-046-10 [Mycobacterium sp. PO2]|nr:uncharacterized protein PO2_contig-046-10 [Mycobacterium sp. PO2]
MRLCYFDKSNNCENEMATYNCIDSTNNAYGSGGYGTCTGQTIGAPNTGFFDHALTGGGFTVLLPLAVAILIVGVATLLFRRRRSRQHPSS